MNPVTGNILLRILLNYDKKREAWALFDWMLDNQFNAERQSILFSKSERTSMAHSFVTGTSLVDSANRG